MARLVLQGVRKVYPGGPVAADGIDLVVEPGERFVVVGPSGSGKSTLLRLIAGLEPLDAGSISLDGRRIDGLPPLDRDVAMVFQGQVLYPHLDVAANLGFGLHARRRPRAEVDAAVRSIAATLGLADCLDRRPETLSGGQRQRVALGRALAVQPGVLLLDEPFNGLDAPLRAALRAELAEVGRRGRVTMVLVTHDQAEAMALADRLAVLDAGRVVQVDAPQAVYDVPATPAVARFVGHPPMNVWPVEAARDGDGYLIRPAGLDLAWRVPEGGPPAPGAWDLAVRSEHVGLLPDPSGPAEVTGREPTGPRTLVLFRLGPARGAAWVDPGDPIRVGDRAGLAICWDRAVWYRR